MPLQRGEVLGYDFNRMVVDFTMFNQGKRLRSGHRVSSSKGQSRLKGRWCCDPTISSSSHLVPRHNQCILSFRYPFENVGQ